MRVIKKIKHCLEEIGYAKSHLKDYCFFRFLPFFILTHYKHLLKQEYYAFDFYHKTKSEIKEYVFDYEVMTSIPDKFNKKEDIHFLDNKLDFNEMFRDLLGRDYVFIDKTKKKEFDAFLDRYKIAIVKPINQLGGNGIRKINKFDTCFDDLINNYKEFLLEEVFQQCDELGMFNRSSINTIRVLAMRDRGGVVHIPFANIRIGRLNSVVDNFCSGGMTAAIDVFSGIVISEAFDKNFNKYYSHPDSSVKIVGFKIPCWNDVISTVRRCMDMIPSLKYVGWDVAISLDHKICLIEGNHNPEARLHQVALGRGIRNSYIKYLGKF